MNHQWRQVTEAYNGIIRRWECRRCQSTTYSTVRPKDDDLFYTKGFTCDEVIVSSVIQS